MKLKVKKLSATTGLMLRKRPKIPVLLHHPGRSGIHTWFVFYPIDACFLDSNGIVVDKVSFLKPWRVYKPKCQYSFVVEAQGGHLYNIGVGDRLDLEVARW